MAQYSKHLLSGSVDGKAIPVAATATPGTLIHTAIDGTVKLDEIYLWVSNVGAADVTLTIEFGGVSNPGDHLVHTVAIPIGSLPFPICTGLLLQHSLEVRAFSGTANALNIFGFVNRIA